MRKTKKAGNTTVNEPKNSVISEPPIKLSLAQYPPRLFCVLGALLIQFSLYSVFPDSPPHGTAVVLLCFLLLALSQWKNLAVNSFWRGLIVLGGCLPILWPGASAALQLLSFAIILAVIASNCEIRESRSAAGLLVMTALLITLLLFEQTGLMWQQLSNICWSTSFLLSQVTTTGLRYGPSPMGITWYIAPVCLWLSQLRFNRSDMFFQVRLLLCFLVGAAASLATGQLLFVAFTSVLIAAFGDWDSEPIQRTQTLSKRVCLIAYGCCVLGLLLFTMGYFVHGSKPRTVGILDGGLKTLELPSRTKIAEAKNAVFGGLTLLLPYYGWNTHVLPVSFEGEELNGIGVLCIINPQISLTPVQQESVERYVRQGGALLVLGDHTDIGGIREPLNNLLRFTHIRFNYDSAIPLDKDWQWKSCLRGALHPVFWGKRNDELGVSVGASLTCRAPSRVLVVGDRSFSDLGRPTFGVSHLGNESYDPGERLGGLPLVAEERLGDGMVQVWGDTSGFQDSVLTNTHSTIASALERLYTNRSYQIPAGVFALCLLILSTVCILYLSSSSFYLLTALVCGCALFYLPAQFIVHIGTQQTKLPAPRLDCSHQPLYPQPDASFHQFRLHETFLRHGQVLLKTDTLDDLSRSGTEWWVISSPTRKYTISEAEKLKSYVEKGGRLLLIAGYAHRSSIVSILNAFNLDISIEPFGASHNSRLMRSNWRKDVLVGNNISDVPPPSTVDSSAYDAEISFSESNPIISKEATPLVSCWGRNIAVSRKIGEGRVVLIADSRFCTDKNLGKERINVANIRFLLKCLEE